MGRRGREPTGHIRAESSLFATADSGRLRRQKDLGTAIQRSGLRLAPAPPRRHSPRRPRSQLPPSPGARWPPFPGVTLAVAAIPRPHRSPPSARREAHSFEPRREAEPGSRGTLAVADGHDGGSPGGRAGRTIGETRRFGSAWVRRFGLRPGAHRSAGVERAEPVARRGRARFGRSRGCLMQCFADELDLFTGFALRQAA
jgi:hypothetical protein